MGTKEKITESFLLKAVVIFMFYVNDGFVYKILRTVFCAHFYLKQDRMKKYIKKMRNFREPLSLSQWTFIQDILLFVTVHVSDDVSEINVLKWNKSEIKVRNKYVR